MKEIDLRKKNCKFQAQFNPIIRGIVSLGVEIEQNMMFFITCSQRTSFYKPTKV
jgi:hypothetical protein